MKLCVLTLIGVASLASGRAAEVRYTVTDLGPKTQAERLNNAGDVVGGMDLQGNPSRFSAFIFSHGKMQDLPALGRMQSSLRGINDAGEIIGELWLPMKKTTPGGGAEMKPFIYSDGIVRDLTPAGLEAGRHWHRVIDINNAGMILAETDGNPSRFYILSKDKVTLLAFPLGSVPPDMEPVIEAARINARGQVIGTVEGVKWVKISEPFAYTKAIGSPAHGILFTDGQALDLGDFIPTALNDSGQIVGSRRSGDGKGHAVLRDGTGLHDLGALPGFERSVPRGINARGQIVGYAETVLGSRGLATFINARAFLYEHGQWKDLNGLVELKGTGLSTLTMAWAINDRGQIICQAMGTRTYHAVLLTPIERR